MKAVSVQAFLALILVATSAACRHVPFQQTDIAQWRVYELSFWSDHDYQNPFDYRANDLEVEFRGPNDVTLTIPGFWDGGRVWKVRFAPPLPGKWNYRSSFSRPSDGGLHDRLGSFRVREASCDTQLNCHGGFLKVDGGGHFLTYTDGTPFFWLADTWWRVPSADVPFETFTTLVDRRATEGFTAYQSHGFRPFTEGSVSAFDAVLPDRASAIDYWRLTDRYYEYAADRGLIAVTGFAGNAHSDPYDVTRLMVLWRYFIARYGAYPVTFLLTQEYNSPVGEREQRIRKFLELGAFIKAIDPYKRAISIHPWQRGGDTRDVWQEPWLDFVMLQSGHFRQVTCKQYFELYLRKPPRPFVEAEGNYEAFERNERRVDEAVIRRTAYTAIQCGALGYTYGAQGLYAGITDRTRPGPSSAWGPVLTVDEGLDLPGGRQLSYLRNFYERAGWWRTSPRPDLSNRRDVLVRADGTSSYLVYFVARPEWTPRPRLLARNVGAVYLAEWLNPRNGAVVPVESPLEVGNDGIELPVPTPNDDWLLSLRRATPGS